MTNSHSKLFKALGEDEIAFEKLLPTRLVKLAIRRLNHNKIDTVIFDFGLPERIMIQCTPTEFENETEFGVLTFKLIDRPIQNEENVDFEPVNILKLERALLRYEDKKITLGMRVYSEGKEPVDILGGNVLATLTIFGWGFSVGDQDCEFPSDEYVFEPWL